MSDRERRVSTPPPDGQAQVLSSPPLCAESADPLACSSDPGALDTDAAVSSDGRNRRTRERFEVTWSVDCATEDTFLFAAITNISEMGIFVKTIEPLAVGTALTLRFAPDPRAEPFILRGIVAWVNELRPLHDNPNPGMGICFSDLLPGDRERIVEAVHTIAYLRDVPTN
ncbi:MAG: PilZ domain-containing protein [Minicystis sp.]